MLHLTKLGSCDADSIIKNIVKILHYLGNISVVLYSKYYNGAKSLQLTNVSFFQIDEEQYKKILSLIESGKSEGASLLTGGIPSGRQGLLHWTHCICWCQGQHEDFPRRGEVAIQLYCPLSITEYCQSNQQYQEFSSLNSADTSHYWPSLRVTAVDQLLSPALLWFLMLIGR